MRSRSTDDNYKDLMNAIVAQAAKDYQTALCDYYNYIGDDEDKKKMIKREVETLEKFFCGDDIMWLTKLNGVALMNRLKQECIDYNYDIKKIRKSHIIHKTKKVEKKRL